MNRIVSQVTIHVNAQSSGRLMDYPIAPYLWLLYTDLSDRIAHYVMEMWKLMNLTLGSAVLGSL